jgi:TonB family protein
MLPFAQDLKPGSAPEIVELTAPGRVGRRFWVTFDHPTVLTAELPAGRGVVEATEEETVIALGGKSVDGEHRPAEVAPPASSHHGGHHRSSGGLTLAKGTVAAGEQHAPSEAPPEPKAVPAAPLAKTESPPPPKAPIAVAPAAPKVEPTPGPPSKPAVARPPAPSGLDPAKTQAVVKSRLPEIQRCYERGKMDYPDMKGRVTLRISVSESGGVTSAMVETSSLGSSSVESCIVGVVKAWKFPAPVGGPAVISYPFNLR